MRAAQLRILGGTFIAWLSVSPLAEAQAPLRAAGDGFLINVTGGTFPLAGFGYFLLLAADSGNAYQGIGIYNCADTTGTYFYQATSDHAGMLHLNDATDGVIDNIEATFATATQGTFRCVITYPPRLKGACQSGTFARANGTALSTLAGESLCCSIADGHSPFASSGQFTMAFAAVGNTYELRDAGGARTSTGTASCSRVNRSTAAIQIRDSATGQIIIYLAFSGLSSGTYALRHSITGGFQVGSFTVVDTTARMPSDRLALQAVGQGTITPNYSNAWLEIGQSYRMSARGMNGHAFANWVISTNWLGGVTHTNPTLNFVMESNLTVQAVFEDVARPTLTIASPKPNQRLSAVFVTVNGTARDNSQLAAVWCQTNGVWGLAKTANHWTNWSVDFVPRPGANTVRGCAQDAALNRSTTQSVSFVYVATDRLKVEATGPCTMTPNYSNAVLELGKSYTTTVVPRKGFVFAHWLGKVQDTTVLASSTPKLTFTMQSKLALQAVIIANPFSPVKGTYTGLFAETNRAQASSGSLVLTLSDSGSYSGTLRCGASAYRFTGQFDVEGVSYQVIPRTRASSWVAVMELDFAAQQLRGWISNAVSGGWVADFQADRATFDTRTNPATQYAGRYTIVIPGATNEDGTVWLGDGYLTLTVDLGGKVTCNGSLADGTSIGPVSAPLSAAGNIPLFVPLYGGKGSVWSWLSFDTNQPASGLGGWLSWIKPP